MRTLFTIYNVVKSGPAFKQWMTKVGIDYRERIVLTATDAVVHFVVDSDDYNSITAVAQWVDTTKRRWEITACNKQYVTEFHDGSSRYIGSMCQVDTMNAIDHNEQQHYHWSLYDGKADVHWVPEFRNPNTMRCFTSEPMKVLGVVTGRWPVDPRCPKPGLREDEQTGDYVNHRSDRAERQAVSAFSVYPL